MVARPDPLRRQVVGQPVGPGLHLGVGPPLPVGDQVLPLGVGVDGRLEQVGEVELHRRQIRTRSRCRGKWAKWGKWAQSAIGYVRCLGLPGPAIDNRLLDVSRSPRVMCTHPDLSRTDGPERG